MKKAIFFTAALLAALTVGCNANNQTVQADIISQQEAESVALTASGISQENASFSRTELEMDDGKQYYEVEFMADGERYTYDIDAMTGTVISFDVEQSKDSAAQPQTQTQTQSQTQNQTAATGIDEAAAKQTALKDAGLTEDAVTFVKVKREYDDGRERYEVAFYENTSYAEYDYEIDAASGEVISRDYDAEDYSAPQQSGTKVSEATVKQTVLAKVPGATESDMRMELERDDGREQYEGTIIYDNIKYEFSVDAYSGAIREWESESVFD